MIAVPLIARRLLLHEMQADDWRFVQTLQAESDSHAPAEVRRTEQAAREFVQRVMAQQAEQPRTTYRFVIVLRAAQRPIGWCDLYVREADAGEAEIGFRVDARYWGCGYATEAAWLMVTFAFDRLGVQQVWGECAPDNHASSRVMQKLGMQPCRSTTHQRDGGDVLVYALRSDVRQAGLLRLDCGQEATSTGG